MAKPIPTFISFDYDHDDDLRIMLVGQSKNRDTPFSIADWSVKTWADINVRRYPWPLLARVPIGIATPGPGPCV